MTEWVVVVEIMAAHPVDHRELQRLLSALADFGPVALTAGKRYALHLRITDELPELAMSRAMSRWRGIVEQLSLEPGDILRSEVMIPAEMERDIELANEGRPIATTDLLRHDPVVWPDRVVPAVLSVLAGGDPLEVAQTAGTNSRYLIRWCDLFVEGGRQRLAGVVAPGGE